MSIIYKKLNNPPISEVVLGLSCVGLFNTLDEINDFISKFSSVSEYKETDTIHTVSFEMSGIEMKLGKNVTLGSVLCSDNKEEQIHIECNKLMFIDRSKYSTFENFMNKFYIVLKEIFEYKHSNINVEDIGLRYVNRFLFSNEKVQNNFLINQSLKINNEQEEFAEVKNSLFISHIKSPKYKNMLAIVKTMQNQVNSASMDIIFDIDAHLSSNYTIDNLEHFKNEVLKLKEFKNQIFFSNFNDIYNIKEFQ